MRFTHFILATFLWMSTASDALAVPSSFADLAEKYSPTVVNIATSTKPKKRETKHRSQTPPGLEGTPFEDFFKDFLEQMPQNSMPAQSLGSGVVISADGYIVTNNHVVQGADDIVVRFHDDEELNAELIGRDPKTDLALIKVDAEADLAFASFGDSDKIRVGDWVVAIGNPFGLGGTVTAGIISARNRNINQGPYDDFLQTDAAINPGNSGGPLFDTAGNIVGINSIILTRSGGSQGIGFSIAANTAKLVIGQLKDHGRTIRGWLGVRIQTITKDLAEALDIDAAEGALVASVVADSPAEKGGVEDGDIILSFDGKKIKEMKELPRIVAETKVNKKVPVKVLRGGKKRTLDVVISELEEDEMIEGGSTEAEEDMLYGMSMAPLTTEMREKLDVDEDVKGVVIDYVERGSAASRSGIMSGDVITRVGKKKVSNKKELRDKVEDAGKSVLMLVHRRGSNLYLAFKKEEDDD